MDKNLVDMLKKINGDDLKTMFGTSFVSYIEKQPEEEVREKLKDYLHIKVAVKLGDIIEYKGEQYCVTCLYTDNSVDVCGKDSQKINTGLYMKNIKIVGKMQIIREG